MVKTYGDLGAPDVTKLAAIGSSGNQPTHFQRDLLKIPQLKNLPVPEARKVEAYVFKNKGTQTTVEKDTIYYFSICDWWKSLKEHGLLEQLMGSKQSIQEFWNGVSPNDPKMYQNPVKDVKDYKKKSHHWSCMVMLDRTRNMTHAIATALGHCLPQQMCQWMNLLSCLQQYPRHAG